MKNPTSGDLKVMLDAISAANYHYENLESLFKNYSERNLKNMSVIIDVNHSNSRKRPLEQIRICKEVVEFFKYSYEIKSMVKGIMLESYLEDGNQPLIGSVYGKSLTDPCLGWDKTEKLIYEIAERL
jgi:3-deoxy-7-phosphoheptulonate synthase